jgi:ribokinase
MAMNEPSIQVFGLGQCSLDYIGKIEAYPQPDRKCEFSDLVIQGGGPVATALVALAKWGVSCAFAGVRGDDLFGDMIRDSLEEEGIDIRGLGVRKGYGSQFAFIAAEPGMGRRTIFWRRPTGPSLGPDEIDYSMIERANILHTDGAFVDATLAACEAARKAGVRVVADADTFYEGLVDLAKFSDYFIASEHFADAFLKDKNPMEACRRIAELGPRVVGVTLGRKGYVALAEGRVIEKPAYPVEPVDTTGCGDVFHAGFIFGLIRGWDYEKCLDFAAWSAAMVSLQMGGRSGIPSPKQIQEKGFG